MTSLRTRHEFRFRASLTPHIRCGERSKVNQESDHSGGSQSNEIPDDSATTGSGGYAGQDQPPWWHEDFDEDGSNPHAVSSAAQEAVKLAAAVATWAQDSGVGEILRGVVEQASDTVRTATASATGTAGEPREQPDPGPGAGEHTMSCEVCPICQGMDVLNEVSPEAAQGVTDALALVTAALKQALDTVTSQSGGSASSGVEHINID